MPTQRITVAKICGESANHLSQLFQRWRASRQAVDVDEYSPHQWSREIQAEVDRWIEALRENSARPPVMFYAEYVDLWSSSPAFRHFGAEHLIAITEHWELSALPLPAAESLVASLKRIERSAQWNEDRWFANTLRFAIDAWKELADSAMLVVTSEVTGPLVEDSEAVASFKQVPNWLKDF